jgi:hypothetical protein
MAGLASYFPTEEGASIRRCIKCSAELHVTPKDELVCPRCGRARAWTVSINGKVVAAGREHQRGGIGIWLSGKLEDLRPVPDRKPAKTRSGWSQEE